ncbi:starvation-inducible DNA-binding protein [Pontibacter ummariensis]|uniref:Starvation-inducible DNA-binding protein n=1 Tax=Pontibacter ummariensis TaxID=1610492 RepID=A0A239L9Y6_9BACT|nr:Dps family protein [Pontibacter ummariensis]PRY04003.1 starvation-inducible DNA-binding protein [Pontibacter ummariensis]SNT26792.1 starvation-inducible DNA-binding protein [Pontibacter ummariensis]
MANTNLIGIDADKATQLADKLNQLLANYQLFYINARGFHWNISGNKFFELHAKFEELYNDAILKIDEIAERILTLGHTPYHSFTEYLEKADIKEVSNVSEGREAIREVLNGFSILIKAERELLDLSGEADDEGTNALMSDYIREQEKLVWMYSAYLKGNE